jgi:hypothetical protein
MKSTRSAEPWHIVRAVSTIVLAGILLTTSCGRAPSLSDQVLAAGGAAALFRDCKTLMAEHQKTQKEVWTATDTNLPATIAALRPQLVRAAQYDGFPMVDIQTSGGFSHRGLMVIPTNTPPDYVPRKSSWRVFKMTDGIFEYRE